jgi:hypothetical protein
MGAASFPAPWKVFFGVWLIGNTVVIVALHTLTS